MDGRLIFVLAILAVTSVVAAALDVTTLFGEANLVRSGDGRSVKLLLDRSSGSGFISTATYHHGLFSASIKLPQGYTAGVVVAFYTSNGDVFEKTHDELDFEFLGNVHGQEWRVQTNVYGNGSTGRGREERYLLPFDPTKEFHRYSILWTAHSIIFSIDGTPIREVGRCDGMSGDYPSKPMSIYTTIWDASDWATSGGSYKVDYDRAPFVAEFSYLALLRCRVDPIQQVPGAAANCTGMAVMTPKKQREMRAFRQRYMSYSFCYDKLRYPVTLPDCNVVESERRRFGETGHRRRVRHRRQADYVRMLSMELDSGSRKLNYGYRYGLDTNVYFIG